MYIYTSIHLIYILNVYSSRNELGQHSPEALAKSLKDIEDVRALTGNIYTYTILFLFVCCRIATSYMYN